MARSHHRDADNYLARQRTLRTVGIIAIVLVGIVTIVLVALALADGPA